LRFTLLGSGSSGNVAYVEAANTRVLVDAGLPKSEIEARLLRIPDPDGPITIDRIDAVLVTHEHSDHIGCAGSLKRPLWATAGTRRAGQIEAQLVRSGDRFRVGALEVLPVLLPHDADETVGYVLSDGESRVGVLTDCGWEAPDVAQAFAGCDVLALETNHDVTMLKFGPYPPSLKRRVGGRRGHLSNDQSAALLRLMMQHGPAPKLVIAAHLSQANNRPLLAKRALDRVLGRNGRVLIATQARGCPLIAVEGGRVRHAPDRHEQLTFEFAQRVFA
jgi:phosphoribosyl 1,2-cyclic phosphodiesterase